MSEGARVTSLKTANSPARTGRSGPLRPGADSDVVLARLRQVVVGVLAHVLKFAILLVPLLLLLPALLLLGLFHVVPGSQGVARVVAQ